ncbi:MAG: hypothetical protein FIA90_09640 [candidate division NC10 bacterium]|nr:hypothetical protein [candidate division NC10 bacterium]
MRSLRPRAPAARSVACARPDLLVVAGPGGRGGSSPSVGRLREGWTSRGGILRRGAGVVRACRGVGSRGRQDAHIVRGFRASGRSAGGADGVGKTTTIAKLAAACHFREGKRVALITTDTYRIAGAQQLKSYAELIGLPFCVAPLPADLRRALTNDRDADVIFIDTVGRSARRQDQLEELATYARRDDGYEVHLVLSATTKRADLLQAVEGYRPLHFSSIIATKIDETATVGPMCEAALAAAVPISYFTTGQEVPDDIEEAQPLRLARRLVGESERREEG